MFGYRCEKCHKGTVRATKLDRFETRFDGVPFVVENATIGVCDSCGERHFNAEEWKAWREQFWKSQESQGRILSADAIEKLRQNLGFSIAEFAKLIGCSRQSLYVWESPSRKCPQSRTVDLIVKLIREAEEKGPVNVVDFLLRETSSEAGGSISAERSVRRRRSDRPSRRCPSYDLAQADPVRYGRLFATQRQPAGFSPVLMVVLGR
jgi:putative zinc finger/helix-turn-helix YgiT family protein